jgi:hypothetical protein
VFGQSAADSYRTVLYSLMCCVLVQLQCLVNQQLTFTELIFGQIKYLPLRLFFRFSRSQNLLGRRQNCEVIQKGNMLKVIILELNCVKFQVVSSTFLSIDRKYF